MGVELQRQLTHWRECHNRLTNPVNAVKDIPINLRRRGLSLVQAVAAANARNPPPEETPPPVPTPKKRTCSKIRKDTVLPHPTAGINWWTGRITCEMVMQHAINYYDGLTVEQIIGRRRVRLYCEVRQVIIYLCFKLVPGVSFTKIGRVLHKDHTSILHASRRMTLRLMNGDDKMGQAIEAIEASICHGSEIDAADTSLGQQTVSQKEVAAGDEGCPDVSQPRVQELDQVGGTGIDAAATRLPASSRSRAVQCEFDFLPA